MLPPAFLFGDREIGGRRRGLPSRRPYHVRKPISRVLYRLRGDGHSSGTYVAARLEQPTRAAGLEADLNGHSRPRRPYLVLLPVGFTVPRPLPARAVRSYRTLSPLPCFAVRGRLREGGLLSVALSLGSPPPEVIRHRAFHGARTFLSARLRTERGGAAIRPSDTSNKGAGGVSVKLSARDPELCRSAIFGSRRSRNF